MLMSLLFSLAYAYVLVKTSPYASAYFYACVRPVFTGHKHCYASAGTYALLCLPLFLCLCQARFHWTQALLCFRLFLCLCRVRFQWTQVLLCLPLFLCLCRARFHWTQALLCFRLFLCLCRVRFQWTQVLLCLPLFLCLCRARFHWTYKALLCFRLQQALNIVKLCGKTSQMLREWGQNKLNSKLICGNVCLFLFVNDRVVVSDENGRTVF